MPVFEITALLLLAALAWFWFDSFKARDIGMRAAKAACDKDRLQLLDATVALASLKPVRDEEGRLVLGRVYAFEYSATGDDRQRGSIVMVGQQVIVVRCASTNPALH